MTSKTDDVDCLPAQAGKDEKEEGFRLREEGAHRRGTWRSMGNNERCGLPRCGSQRRWW